VPHNQPNRPTSFWTKPRHPLRFFATIGLGTLWLVLVPGIAAATIFSAVIINNSNSFSSGNLVLTGVTPDTLSCASTTATIVADASTCTGNPFPTATLTTSASTPTITTLSNGGSLSPSTGLAYSTGCSVQQFTDSSSAGTDPALPVAGTTLGASMSTLATSAASFDGTTGWAETVKSSSNPENFTIAGWFNTTTTTGGTLIGYSAVQTTAGSTSNDREIWIDPTGHVVWSIESAGTTVTELTSPSAYNNGAWHFVVATIGTTSKDQLYVDGTLVASNATPTTAWSYTGYWTLGWGSEASASPVWTDKPTSIYFKGSLFGVAIIPSQLTAANVTSLYSAASLATYNTTIAGFTPTTYWQLNDAGSAGYTGVLPTETAATLKFYDASGHTNTGSPGTGSVTTAAAGPVSGTAITLNGASGSAVNTTTGYTSPQTFSQSIWFKTTASGVIMGLTNVVADTGTSTSHDHMLWIDATGHLVFGVDYGTTPVNTEMTSSGTYNNGAWHLAVVTGSTTGTVLYADGVQVASNATALTVTSYTGYWHLGYGYATGWTNAPTSNYLTGSLAHAAYYTTTLSAAQVASLYSPQTTAGEAYAVLALTPSAYWPLYDVVMSSACAIVEVTIGAVKGAVTSCVEPYVAAAACAAPSTAVEATTLLPKAMPPPITGTTVAISLTFKLTATPSAGVAGLHLRIPLTLMTQSSSFTSQITYNQTGVVL